MKKRTLARREEILESMFPTQEPCSAVDGIANGLWSAGAGIMAGGAAFIAAPIMGAQQEGVGGFVKGLGLGVVSFVPLSGWYTVQ